MNIPIWPLGTGLATSVPSLLETAQLPSNSMFATLPVLLEFEVQ